MEYNYEPDWAIELIENLFYPPDSRFDETRDIGRAIMDNVLKKPVPWNLNWYLDWRELSKDELNVLAAEMYRYSQMHIEQIRLELLSPVMRWKSIKTPPIKPGFYECYFPESQRYKEHHSEKWFDGESFLSGDVSFHNFFTFDTRKDGVKVNEYISHWMEIFPPTT